MTYFVPVKIREFPPDLPDMLRIEQKQHETVAAYITHLQTRFGGTRAYQKIARAATFLEPIGLWSGSDPKPKLTAAYLKGTGLGLRIVSNCLEDFDQAFGEVEPKVDLDSILEPEERQRIGRRIHAQGLRAYTNAGEPFEPLLRDWTLDIESDVRTHPHFRSGVGMPLAFLAVIRDFNDRQLQADIEAAYESIAGALARPEEIQWDMLFSEA